jgi:hypothetical protein
VNVVESIKFRAPLPSGCYIAVIADSPKPRAIDERGRVGVSLTLKVMEGDAKGRMAAIELIIQASSGASRVARDLDLLKMWCDCLGAGSATSLVELVEKLRQAATGKRLEFTLQRNDWAGGVQLNPTSVRIAPAEGAVGG